MSGQRNGDLLHNPLSSFSFNAINYYITLVFAFRVPERYSPFQVPGYSAVENKTVGIYYFQIIKRQESKHVQFKCCWSI